MIIWFLDESPKKTAQFLDDQALSDQIKNIAQVILQIHYKCIDHRALTLGEAQRIEKNMPLEFFHADELEGLYNNKDNLYANWGYECKANYNFLVNLGEQCCKEYNRRSCKCINCRGSNCPYRFQHTLLPIIKWALNNIPEFDINTLCNEGLAKFGCTCQDDITTPFPTQA
jgi:hypothetical protein